MKGLFKLTLWALVFCTVFAPMPTEAELSPAIEILQREDALTKQCIGGSAVFFSAEDFHKVAGGEATEILLCTLPSPKDGALKIAGVDAIPSQRISAATASLLKFVPAEGFDGEAAFSFSIDGAAERRCVIRYSELRNMAPVAADSVAETYGGVCVAASLDCYDPEGDSLTYSVKRWPVGGTLRFENGYAVYSPTENFLGVDSFVYTATDMAGNVSDPAVVTVSVTESAPFRFEDMQDSAAAFAAMQMAKQGVMDYAVIGGGCYFRPEATVTRAEFAVMLIAATETPLPEKPFPTEVFTDTLALTEHARFCIEKLVTGGFLPVEGEYFRPHDPISTAEAATMTGVLCDGDGPLTRESAAKLLFSLKA